MLQPYGRYTNASRFAGETDGLEAIASVQNNYPIDTNRIVMAGFSMGGASAWSYIVHFADRWVAGAPGAGFTETEVFLRGALGRQPQNPVQRTLWHMYDSTDYAINTFNVPVVAYSGEIDAQKQAADAMATAMSDEGLKLEHIIGPNTAHAYEPAGRQRLQDRFGSTRVGRTEPRTIRDSLHDLDASLQQDVLDHGRWNDGGVAARASKRQHRRPGDHAQHDQRFRTEPELPAGACPVHRWDEACSEDRFRYDSVAPDSRRQGDDGCTDSFRRGVENGNAQRPSQGSWPAGAD